MWPFKKPVKEPDAKPAKSVICIPGNWKDFEDFHGSLIVTSGASYMVVGNILINGKDKRHYSFEFCDRDPRMKDSFRVAGRVTEIGDETLEEIADHKYVIYISGETESLEGAEQIARAGMAVLNTGGIALKIESAGKAFSKAMWLEFMTDFEPERHLYDMFVLDSIIDTDGTVFSCGMHNLGLKDSIVSNEEFEDAMGLIRIFGYYQIVDKPDIKNNQTFQPSPESPLFRITNELHPPYANNEVFHNPFGMWRLAKIDQ
jgi:hypothetical protein